MACCIVTNWWWCWWCWWRTEEEEEEDDDDDEEEEDGGGIWWWRCWCCCCCWWCCCKWSEFNEGCWWWYTIEWCVEPVLDGGTEEEDDELELDWLWAWWSLRFPVGVTEGEDVELWPPTRCWCCTPELSTDDEHEPRCGWVLRRVEDDELWTPWDACGPTKSCKHNGSDERESI